MEQSSFIKINPADSVVVCKFNVQCVTESSIFACVATLCVLLIIYSSSPSVAVIKPSDLLNSSLANA